VSIPLEGNDIAAQMRIGLRRFAKAVAVVTTSVIRFARISFGSHRIGSPRVLSIRW